MQARKSEKKAVVRRRNTPETGLRALAFPLPSLPSEKKHEGVDTIVGENSYLKRQFKKLVTNFKCI